MPHEIIIFFSTYWDTIASNPIIFTSMILIFILVGYIISSLLSKNRISLLKEHNIYLRQKLHDVNNDKDALLDKLNQYGANIEHIKNELKVRPKIHIGDTPPDDKSSLWYDTKT